MEPWPGVLVTESLPVWASIMRRTMARPRPVLFSPAVGRTLVFEKSLNNFPSSFSGMPCPWSITEIVISPLLALALMMICLSLKENFMAFPMRLSKTCVMRPLSKVTSGRFSSMSNEIEMFFRFARIDCVF